MISPFSKAEHPSGTTLEPQTANPTTQRKKRFNWKHKTGLIFFGLIVSHLILELVLRGAGIVYFYESENQQSNHPESAYVVLAVGDSVTYGYESSNPQTKSYPAQLQSLLKQRAPHQDIRVEKLGFPGANSSQLARRLEGFMHLHNPDLLILLAGNNDIWNLNETRAELVSERAEWEPPLEMRAQILLEKIYVVRFYKRLCLLIDDDRKETLNAQKGASPSSSSFKKGHQLLGNIANVQHLYEYNFREMLELAADKGIEVIVLDYHHPARLKETEYLKPALKTLGVEMVDLEPHFVEAADQGHQVITTRGLKWHPNDLGYALISRIVYNEMVRREIVNADPINISETDL